MPRWYAGICILVSAVAMGAARPKTPQPPAAPVVRTNGVPYPVGRFAKPTYGPDYGYGWVGGGAPSRRGEPRRANEGVWGRDYSGVVYHRRVWPNWWHGQREQGGTGAYRPDGLKLLHR
ncbi:MAG TPA: hypothetical protein VHC22_15430 [Pirellulales bacterium]|nr:hypothetical protein [Pirellulales bacterium]